MKQFSSIVALASMLFMGHAMATHLRSADTMLHSHVKSNQFKINPVPSLDVTKFLGRWYEMYNGALMNVTFGQGGLCATADYGLLPNNSISVYNAQRINTTDGPLDSIHGYAYGSNPKQPAELSVVLFGGSPFPAPYWIVNLGPATYGYENKYEYAVVSDGLELSLFVLARDPSEFRQKYEASVMQWVYNAGFTQPWNKPVPIYQGSNCKYAPLPGTAA